MTKFHRNFTDFLTDHEKHVLDRQTGCARWKATPGATGKASPECQNFMYSTLINPSWISHIAHPLYNHWSYQHTRVPVYPRFILPVRPHSPGQICTLPSTNNTIPASVSFWPLLIIELVAHSVPASLVICEGYLSLNDF